MAHAEPAEAAPVRAQAWEQVPVLALVAQARVQWVMAGRKEADRVLKELGRVPLVQGLPDRVPLVRDRLVQALPDQAPLGRVLKGQRPAAVHPEPAVEERSVVNC